MLYEKESGAPGAEGGSLSFRNSWILRNFAVLANPANKEKSLNN